MMEAIAVGNITIHSEVFTGGVLLAVVLAAYWFHRAYKRFKSRLRYTQADQDAIRDKARRRL